MSAIQGVSAAPTIPAVALTRSAPKAQTSAAESAQQEASESPAVTRTEASKGDQQAIRRLANSTPAANTQKAEVEPAKGGLNLTA